MLVNINKLILELVRLMISFLSNMILWMLFCSGWCLQLDKTLQVIKAKPENMYNAAKRGFATATDLADYLVRKGIPFRDAHEVVGQAVRLGVDSKRDLSELSLAELQSFSAQISEDVFDILKLEGSVAARSHIGGTAPETVKAAIQRARGELLK